MSLAALVYVYAGFPLLVVAVGILRRKRVQKADVAPSVTLIIAAYNEEQTISEKLDNALAMNYPREKLQIIVASDGSTDRTNAIVSACADERVKLLCRPRQGKIHALNAALLETSSEIVVFSDANTIYERDAVKYMMENFADEEVGGVAGNSCYERPLQRKATAEASSEGEQLYWHYDTWLKEMESLTGSVVSAHGGMYAIRRKLYQPLTTSSVTDDFTISTNVVAQGKRLVFERRALAYEEPVQQAGREFQRKVRLMTRGLRGLVLRRSLLNPFRYGFYSLVLFSHKALRRLLPLALMAMAITSVVLAPTSRTFTLLVAGQVCFYSMALIGLAMRKAEIGRLKVLFIPFFYCLANLAALVALIELIRGTRIELWEPQRHTT